MTLPANIRINLNAPFPSLVQGYGPVTISKQNGIWTVGFSVSNLGIQNPPPWANYSTDYALVFDSVARQFIQVPLSSFYAITANSSPTSEDTYGVGSTSGNTAVSFSSTDGSAQSAEERYTAWVGNRSVGTGDGTVSGTTFALGASSIKTNWQTSTVKGQTGGVNSVVRGGYHGDSSYTGNGDVSSYLANIVFSDPWNGGIVLEGVNNFFHNGTVDGTAKSIGVQLGSLVPNSIGQSNGLTVNAANGSVGTGILIQNFATSPAYGTAGTWNSFIRVFYDDGTNAGYDLFKVDLTGITLRGQGSAGTNQKTIAVGRTVTNNLEIYNGANNAVIFTMGDTGNILASDTVGAPRFKTPSASLTLANGLNSNIAGVTGRNRIVGPTGAFSVGGMAALADGAVVKLYNSTGQTMTIVNEDASSTAANRITTCTGANVSVGTSHKAFATLSYDGTDLRWILESVQGA